MSKRMGPKNPSVTAGLMPRMSRREFCQLVTALGVLGYMDDRTAALAMETDERRLGWLANQDPGREGIWDVTDIEGTIPPELEGTFYRTGPGQLKNHGFTLKHLFDGDAFVHAYSIRDGKVKVRARFIETPQRMEEIELGRMIYGEYGTLPPKPPEGAPPTRFARKNQPSVNVVAWDGKLLGLSEGGHPSAINAKTLAFEGYWDYYGTLPKILSHTAHPKFDPVTGIGYTYGIERGPGMALVVMRMELDGKLTQLHRLPQRGFFMIHDMIMTDEHLIFAIPPLKYTLGDMLSGRATPSQALKFYESEPLRYIVMSRDGSGEPITIEHPASTVYHNGNAFTKDGLIHLESCMSPDNSVSEMLNDWTKDKTMDYIQTAATRVTLDIAKKEIVGTSQFGEGQDFPRFDIRNSGKDMQYLYAMENGVPNDPVAFDQIVRHDLHKGTRDGVKAGAGQAFGEACYVENPNSALESDGWIMNLVFDANRNETALEIRDAGSLEFVARAWIGTHLPNGFHGNFVPDWHVA